MNVGKQIRRVRQALGLSLHDVQARFTQHGRGAL